MRAAAIGLTIMLWTACTHAHTVAALHPGLSSVAATAELADGRNVEVRAASTPDGPRWFVRPSVVGAPWTVVDSPVLRRYTVVRHGRGAFEGGFWGGLLGTALGAIIGYAAGDTPCEGLGCLHFNAEANAVLAAVGFGYIGIGVGTAIGAYRGSLDVYQIESEDAPPESSTRIVPIRSGAALAWSF
jgi:hypothetical protein